MRVTVIFLRGVLLVSLSQIQDVPPKNMLLVVGAPGSGKSTFCYQSVLNNLATNRPIIFVTTEHAPADVSCFLQERGLGEVPSAMLSFVDAFHETVGLSCAARPDTVHSSCGNLTSIEVAILKLQD
jgi:GTPase SAR1 family protein